MPHELPHELSTSQKLTPRCRAAALPYPTRLPHSITPLDYPTRLPHASTALGTDTQQKMYDGPLLQACRSMFKSAITDSCHIYWRLRLVFDLRRLVLELRRWLKRERERRGRERERWLVRERERRRVLLISGLRCFHGLRL